MRGQEELEKVRGSGLSLLSQGLYAQPLVTLILTLPHSPFLCREVFWTRPGKTGVRGSVKQEGTKFLGWGNPVAILEATVSHEPQSMVGNVLSPWLLLESSIATSGIIP